MPGTQEALGKSLLKVPSGEVLSGNPILHSQKEPCLGAAGGEPRQEATASAAHRVCLCSLSWNPSYAHPVRTSWVSPSSVPQGQWAQVQKIVPLGTGVPSEPDILGYPSLLWLDNDPASFKAGFFLFIFISWRLITLQHCSGFCHILT